MQEITLIRQGCDSSCGIACAAMVSGKRFSEVQQMRSRPDMTTLELDELLARLGLETTRHLYPGIAPGRLYIASVASLNKLGALHFIVLDTRKAEGLVYDPNKGREGREFYTRYTLRSVAGVVEIHC